MRGNRETTNYPGIYRLGPDHYEVRVQLGRNALTGTYQTKSEHFHGKLKDAIERQAELRKLAKSSTVHVTGWTVTELMTKYFEHIDGKNAYESIRSDKIRWGIMEAGIGPRKARSITPVVLDDLFDQLIRVRKMKPQTLKRYRSLLSAAFRKGLQWGVVSVNPVVGTTTPLDDPFDPEEVDTRHIEVVLEGLGQSKTPQMKELLQVAMINQLRRGEVCAIQLQDFNELQRTLKICRTVQQRSVADGGGWFIKNWPKNRKAKTIELDDVTVKIFKGIIDSKALHSSTAFLFSKDDQGLEPIMPSAVTNSQKHMRDRVCPQCLKIEKYGRKQCSDCRVELGVYFRVHDLRAYTTTLLLDADISPKVVQERGGWQDQKVMRARYHRKTSEATKAATDLLSSHFGSAFGNG